jgi:hypothetical protein
MLLSFFFTSSHKTARRALSFSFYLCLLFMSISIPIGVRLGRQTSDTYLTKVICTNYTCLISPSHTSNLSFISSGIICQ